MSTKRHVIAVLGCHRSGTSAVTRGLQALGGVIGEDLLPPVEGNNPTGFWEDRALHGVLQNAQRRAGSDWDQLGYGWSDEHIEVLLAAKPRISELFDERASDEYPFVFKNPRASLMLPTLREVFTSLDIAVSYVIVVRDPLSTAQSLQDRDGLPLELGALLWLRYVSAAVCGTAGEDRVFVRYDRYLEDPESELGRVQATLNVPQLQLVPSELAELRDDFLQPDLRHHVNTQEVLERHNAVTPPATEAYARLTRAADSSPGTAPPVDDEYWEELVASLEACEVEYRLIDDAWVTLKEQQAELVELRDAPKRLEREADRLSRALEANSQALDSARALLDERAESVDREVEARVEEGLAVAAEQELELKGQIDALGAQLDELQNVTRRLLVERDAARADAAESVSQVDTVMSSTSWRITKPLRLAGDLAKARRRRT